MLDTIRPRRDAEQFVGFLAREDGVNLENLLHYLFRRFPIAMVGQYNSSMMRKLLTLLR